MANYLFWHDEKITHVKMPIDEFRKRLGIEHRIMDLEINAYNSEVTFTIDTRHFDQE